MKFVVGKIFRIVCPDYLNLYPPMQTLLRVRHTIIPLPRTPKNVCMGGYLTWFFTYVSLSYLHIFKILYMYVFFLADGYEGFC